MPKPIKSQEEHDRRFNADKENFRQKYGRMSLEEIAGCGKVRGCTVEYCKEYAKGGLKTHKDLYKIKNGGKSLEEIATSSKRILSRDKWGRKKMSEKEEKKYRPFSLEEFLSKFSIGTKISFRRRDITRSIYGLFEGYQTDKDETEAYYKIIICNLWYTLNDLFEKYEYLDEYGEWQPFGVEE